MSGSIHLEIQRTLKDRQLTKGHSVAIIYPNLRYPIKTSLGLIKLLNDKYFLKVKLESRESFVF